MDKLVFTSKQVIDEGLPILYIVHDNEDDWQFLSTLEKDNSDGRIVGVQEILTSDENLIDLSLLGIGMEARRECADSEWVVSIYH